MIKDALGSLAATAVLAAYSFAKAMAHKLVEARGFCAGGVPFLVEPVQVPVVIRDPFPGGLPGKK